MKKIFALMLCVLLAVLMCGCSLDYSQQGSEGSFSFAYGKKKAFVTEYRWDGSEENMTIAIPEEYDGRTVVAVGGFYGRGLPMPFTVDLSGYFPEDIQWADDAAVPDETVELYFTLILPKSVEDVSWEGGSWVTEEEGKIVAYEVHIATQAAD